MSLTPKESVIKKKLDSHYKYFDRNKISPDPLEFPHRFSNPFDIEISAFVSSVFAYGNVKQIINTLEKLHAIMGNSPIQFVLNYSKENKNLLFKDIKHRFYTDNDIHSLFVGLHYAYREYGCLKNLFLKGNEKEFSLKSSLTNFSLKMTELCSGNKKPTRGITFMFSNPEKGSACKRMNLFLRWMVRKDELDFGLWNEIPASSLLIPVDVHIARICKQLKLTGKKNVSWSMAEEITDRLKKYDVNDPVKYDFAICHIGMRKLKF